MREHVHHFLSVIGSSYMSPSPYDTAWIARLAEYEPEMSRKALDWLRHNELEGGGWGTPEYVYYHERFICTLSAMVALTLYGDEADMALVKRGADSLIEWADGLHRDPGGATIGFELIVPTLIDEAKELGIIEETFSTIFYDMAARRTVKLSRLPEQTINRAYTVAFSTEMIGRDAKVLLDVKNLQEWNGSVAYSPAATAYFALNIKPGDEDALSYLREVAGDGTAPYITPIEVFELGWGLWNMALNCPWDEEILDEIAPHLDFLEDEWEKGRGISACAGLTLIDGDTTGIVYEVLSRYGRKADLTGVLSYEIEDHFRCFPLEANPSISTNIHVLGALHEAGHTTEHRTVQKVLGFLADQQLEGTYWYDKWHASPYYATSHAIIAAMPFDDTLVLDGIDWLLHTQREDGSWGYYEIATAEETAYALQALLMWRRAGGDVPTGPLRQAADWLEDKLDPPYVPMWIGKSMYSPEWVVHGAILSARLLAESDL